MINNKVIQYIISFLLADYVDKGSQLVFYGNPEDAPLESKVIILPSAFFEDGIYGTEKTLPETPFCMLPQTDIPFLFGTPEIEKTDDGRIVIYADLIASAYFMLSRYEEIIKPQCRDRYGRFLAKNAVVFQQGYGFRPLVDEWGRYLRNLLRQTGVSLPEEERGFSKIWLTHDVDRPFRIPTLKSCMFEIARIILRRKNCLKNPLGVYFSEKNDPFYTFPWIIKQDNKLKDKLGEKLVESVYFLISGKSTKHNKYYPVKAKKYIRLLNLLKENDATLGLHVSHEGGENPDVIAEEISRLPSCVDRQKLYSRHHYLKWREPEHIEYMEKAEIKEDFSLGYADSVGFRCGTSKSYYFINPRTESLTDVIIHPMQIMECSLDGRCYMGLTYQQSKELCKKIILEVNGFNGELNLLWHNTSFTKEFYHEKLYVELLEYIKSLKLKF